MTIIALFLLHLARRPTLLLSFFLPAFGGLSPSPFHPISPLLLLSFSFSLLSLSIISAQSASLFSSFVLPLGGIGQKQKDLGYFP
jgi:hypothetical protein